MLIRFIVCLFLGSLCQFVYAKSVVGWVEKAVIMEGNIPIKAKIDSGARHSSMHCGCEIFTKKDGSKWARLSVENYNGETAEIETKIVRQAKIKRHDGKRQIRNVIKLTLCLGNVAKEVEINLINRDGLNYQLLVGRSFLKEDFLINTAKKFLHEPRCNKLQK